MLDTRAVEFRQNLKIMVMFLIAQFFGLFLATQAYSGTAIVIARNAQVGGSIYQAVFFIAAIVVFAVLLVILLKRTSSGKFMILLEAFAIVGASFFVFLILIGMAAGNLQQVLFGSAPVYQYVAAFLLAVALIIAKNKWPRLRNAVAIFASVGIGLVIGINLTFLAVFLFMGILAVYDFIAVFITKHMVTMGQAAIKHNLALMITATDVEAMPRGALSKQEAQALAERHTLMMPEKSIMREIDRKNLVPFVASRALGNGDIAVPLMVSVAAYKVLLNFTLSIVVTIGAVAGLLLCFYILSRYKKMLPAIPPLMLGITVAVAVYLIAIGVV